MAIRTAMIQLGASLLGQLLAADTGHRGPRSTAAPVMGPSSSATGQEDRHRAGPGPVRRAYYHCAACERGIVPRDDEFGVAGVSLSPGCADRRARRRRRTVRHRRRPAGRPGRNPVDPQADRTLRRDRRRRRRGAHHRRVRRDRARPVAVCPPRRPRPAPDKLYIAIDGTGVPMVAAAAPAAPVKPPTGAPAPARSNSPACSPRPPSTTRAGRYVTRTPPATWPASPPPPVRHPGARRSPPPRRRPHPPTRRPGRRRPWIWNLATAILPEATPIVDLYHAREHLHDLAAHLTRLGDTTPTGWPPAWPTSTPATSKPSSPKPSRPHAAEDTANDTAKRWPTSKPTPTGCATPTSASTACSSAPASSRPAASHRRPTPQTVRHALEHPRRHRHPHPALPPGQRPLRPHLDTSAQPDHRHRMTSQQSRSTPVTYKSVAHPFAVLPRHVVGRPRVPCLLATAGSRRHRRVCTRQTRRPRGDPFGVGPLQTREGPRRRGRSMPARSQARGSAIGSSGMATQCGPALPRVDESRAVTSLK